MKTLKQDKAGLDFIKLVARVREIDPEAADWLLEPETNPDKLVCCFTPSGNLASGFTWGEAPKGYRYWLAIYNKLYPAQAKQDLEAYEQLKLIIAEIDQEALAFLQELENNTILANKYSFRESGDICVLFRWDETPQGGAYWAALERKITLRKRQQAIPYKVGNSVTNGQGQQGVVVELPEPRFPTEKLLYTVAVYYPELDETTLYTKQGQYFWAHPSAEKDLLPL